MFNTNYQYSQHLFFSDMQNCPHQILDHILKYKCMCSENVAPKCRKCFHFAEISTLHS